MAPDEYQKAWQAEATRTRVTINADLLRGEVQRHHSNFQAVIFWRDFREVGASLLMLPAWIYLGVRYSLPWTWYLTVPSLIWVAGFMLVDRMRHRQKAGEQGEPLVECVTESLAQVEHQIRLLRNVFWWYLLPFCISILAFFTQVFWEASSAWWEFIVALTVSGLALFLVYGVVYVMNQQAVRKQLEPRRQELQTLLANLSDEPAETDIIDADSYNIVPASVSPFAEDVFIAPRSTAASAAFTILGLVGALILVVVLVDFAGQMSEPVYNKPPQTSGTTGDSLANLVTDLRKKKNLVGLGAMVMVDGKIEAAAVHGERKAGSGVPLQISDRWHVGGITKSITATMIAGLVESGQMQWSDTVGSAFPEALIHEDWRPVTVLQLLTHTAGAPANFSYDVRKKRPAPGPERTRVRRETILDVISDQPAHTPGAGKVYSNVGVTIAGAMAEKVTGDTWENLVKEIVFRPLELKEAGFGPPKSSDRMLEQPRGHRTRLSGKLAVGDDADNTPVMSPSGAVHMTLGDLCRYATDHLRGYFREGQLLSTETYRVLHTPELSQYACGWIRRKPDSLVPYTVYWHNGSNTMWYAMVAFIPERNMVIAVTSNDGDVENAEAAAWAILRARTVPAEAPLSAGYSRKSPFAAVRWQESQPEVRLGDEWFRLVSLNDLPASEIIVAGKRLYRNLWRKRFEEDLVELLTRMGHPPQDTVTLVVQSLTTGETSVRSSVPMTEENRRAIRNAARSK